MQMLSNLLLCAGNVYTKHVCVTPCNVLCFYILRQKHGEMSYEHRCSLLKWQTLEKRREFLSLVQCYN